MTNQPVLFDLESLLSLLLGRQNVLSLHADLKALVQSAVLTEPPVSQVHSALLIIQTLEMTLHNNK